MPRPASEDKRLEWKNLIEQQRQSGLSIKEWCQQSQIRPHTFRYWRDKLSLGLFQKTSFTEVKVKRPDTVSLQGRGIYVRMGSDCDPNLRKQLFSLFAGGSC